MFLNERGEILNGDQDPNSDISTGANGEQDPANTEPVIDWENEANPYRKRYADSQGQITPLVRTLQQFAEYDHFTKQWRLKTQAPASSGQVDDVDKLLEGYDPEFKKVLHGFTSHQIRQALAERDKQTEDARMYSAGIEKSRSRAVSEFGTEFEFAKNGKMNTASPLYKLANEIVISKYSQFNSDGSFVRYTNPEAEYLATIEAYAILSKKSKQAPSTDKGKMGAINGKGSKAGGVKRKLSSEEYSKLTTAEKDSYDMAEMGG